jgi:Nucleoporin autopeptidase
VGRLGAPWGGFVFGAPAPMGAPGTASTGGFTFGSAPAPTSTLGAPSPFTFCAAAPSVGRLGAPSGGVVLGAPSSMGAPGTAATVGFTSGSAPFPPSALGAPAPSTLGASAPSGGRLGAPSGGVVLGAPFSAPMGAPGPAPTGGFAFGSAPTATSTVRGGPGVQLESRPGGWWGAPAPGLFGDLAPTTRGMSPFPAPLGPPWSWGAPVPLGSVPAPAVGAPAGCLGPPSPCPPPQGAAVTEIVAQQIRAMEHLLSELKRWEVFCPPGPGMTEIVEQQTRAFETNLLSELQPLEARHPPAPGRTMTEIVRQHIRALENNLLNELKQLEAVWYVPKLSKLEYEVFPTIAELECMSEADLATVRHFSVRRPGYGKVEWEGSVDVRGANLDDIVVIEAKNVSIYQKDEERGTKPEKGTKLNRPVVITFDGVVPREGRGATKEAMIRFSANVKNATHTMNAEFVSYDPETCIWKIRAHYSGRHALLDDDVDSG